MCEWWVPKAPETGLSWFRVRYLPSGSFPSRVFAFLFALCLKQKPWLQLLCVQTKVKNVNSCEGCSCVCPWLRAGLFVMKTTHPPIAQPSLDPFPDVIFMFCAWSTLLLCFLSLLAADGWANARRPPCDESYRKRPRLGRNCMSTPRQSVGFPKELGVSKHGLDLCPS